MLQKMFAWNRYFEDKMKPVLLNKFQAYPDKTIISKTSEAALGTLLEMIKSG